MLVKLDYLEKRNNCNIQISDSDVDNCITVIAESPLSGAIYRYNNYGTKEWQLIGTMLGYA